MFFEFPPEFLSKTASRLRSMTRVLPWEFRGIKGFDLHLDGVPIGEMVLKGKEHNQVSSMLIDPKYRNLGLGRKFYGDAMQQMPNNTLRSDSHVSDSAARIWRGMLRDGYSGVEHPSVPADLFVAGEGKATGLQSNAGVSSSPVFEASLPIRKKADYAPGIPDRHYHADLPTVNKPLTWKMSLQEHHAERAGHHYDLRLIDPDTGHAHSWALPKAQMPEPGKSVLAVQQPTHTSEYALNFGKDKEQAITKGYGKGRVKIKVLEEVEVYHSKPAVEGTRVRFNRYSSKGPEEYAIVRTTSGQDLLVNKTLARHRLPHLDLGSKPKLREGDINAINLSNDSEVMMPKYDGAHTLLDLKTEDRIPRLFSYRLPKRHTAGVIEHTHKVPSLLTTRVPKELRGTVLRTETIGVDTKGRAVPAKDIAGMLNATVPNSRAKQQEFGAHLVPVILDVEKYKGKSVQHLPFKERYELARDIGKQLNLPVTDAAFSSDAKQKLLTRIRAGRHPMTTEGVVLRPLNTEGLATKAKLRPDHDVHVRRIFEAVNKDGEGTGRAGGFEYSWTPRGPIVGRIGTGLDHAMAREMLRNPENYIGRVAKVTAEQRYSSGALGKPSFREWHLDK